MTPNGVISLFCSFLFFSFLSFQMQSVYECHYTVYSDVFTWEASMLIVY